MTKIIYIYILLLIFNCAYESMPQGGPEDVTGPIKLNESPLNKNSINAYDKVIIQFDERINPKSIINSISISPDIDISKKVKGNKIIIEPLAHWPKEPIEIILSRDISDFQLNNMDEGIQIIYNIEDDQNCSIKGKLINGLEKTHNIYLYKWPVDNFQNPIKKINSDVRDYFIFDYLKPGKYIIIASDGNLDIYNNRYGMTTYEYIDLNKINCSEDILIYMDDPLEKMKISRVETVNSKLLNIYYNNNLVEPYLLDVENYIVDSLYINIEKYNRLEKYDIEPYLYLRKNKIDTIPPFISFIDELDSTTIINFSEPINKDSLFILGLAADDLDDENWFNLTYENLNSMSIQISKINLKRLKFIGAFIQDFSQNKMLDSIQVHTFSDESILKENSDAFGMLKGKILNSSEENTIVEARNILLNLSYTEVVKDSSFIFKDLIPGSYVFRIYEQKNEIYPRIYFSGTLEPYKSAAKFSIYKDTVEVRKFWDVEGLNIEF